MNHPTIKAIETKYKGYRFRSRLEARWAVFFDTLGVKWEYEPEGFELSSGRYLPDFRFGIGLWVEIKGLPPGELDQQLMRELCAGTAHRGVIVWSLPHCAEWISFDRDGDQVDCSHGDGRSPFSGDTVKEVLWFDNVSRVSWEIALSAASMVRFEHGETGLAR